MDNPKLSPSLLLYVGQPLTEINRQDSITLNFTKMLDNSPVVVNESVRFSYHDGALSFSLPPTRFVWISQLSGIVYSIRTAPQLRFLALDKAWALGQEIITTIRTDTQWQVVKMGSAGQVELQAELSNPGSKDELRVWLADLEYESKKLELYLQRKVRAGSDKAKGFNTNEDLFLVNVLISDRVLERDLLDKTIDKRLEVSGNPTKPLPITVWLPAR